MDTTGLAIESAWDFINIVWDVVDLVQAVQDGDANGALLAAGSLVVDGLAAALPGIPGGAGAGRRAAGFGGRKAAAALSDLGKLDDGFAFCARSGSKKLRKSMINQGTTQAEGHVTHHIVAQNAKGAEDAREVLGNFGIDIDDPANGVFLPKDYHQSMHTSDYYEDVNRQLENASSQKEAVEILRQIAGGLQKSSGAVP